MTDRTWPPEQSISWHDVELAQRDFEHLLELRTGLRRLLHWSERQARAAGLTPAKHQLLLAVKGHPDPAGPTIGQLADYLALRHHSAVGLVDRAVADGLVKRNADRASKSVVRVTLTRTGESKLGELSEAHLHELSHLAPTMQALWHALDDADLDARHRHCDERHRSVDGHELGESAHGWSRPCRTMTGPRSAGPSNS